MTKLDRFIHLLVAASFGLLLLCCLQPVTAVAQSLAPPLPLPYVTVYGTVAQDGVVLTGEDATVAGLIAALPLSAQEPSPLDSAALRQVEVGDQGEHRDQDEDLPATSHLAGW